MGWRIPLWVFAVSTGCVSRHFHTLYGHSTGLSQSVTSPARPDGFRRHSGAPRKSPKSARTHIGAPHDHGIALGGTSCGCFPHDRVCSRFPGLRTTDRRFSQEDPRSLDGVLGSLPRDRRAEIPKERGSPPAVGSPGRLTVPIRAKDPAYPIYPSKPEGLRL